jgi:sugar phosphate isomerase/epimerase
MSTTLSGFADEASSDLEIQIRATRELGWKNIEMRNVQVPGFPSANLHDIPEEAFSQVVARLGEAGVRVHCFGSAIANGGCSILKPFDQCWAQAKRAAARMPALGSQFIRIMSYPILKDQEDQMEGERFRRLREIQKLFHDSGITVVHENCGNYGGMGWTYALKLLENVPGLKLVFDMGNCVHDLDYSQPAPHPHQSAWEFYSQVRDHIAHLHIKDAIWTKEEKMEHVFPGEGSGEVRRIVTDLLSHGYAGAISIEPHIGVAPLFKNAATEVEGRYLTYVEYGKRFMKLLADGHRP